jgi:hypothetical protein
MSSKPEVWLRGPLDAVPGLLQPVAHALLQAREEIVELMTDFPEALLWEKPAGLASPGFHLQHLAGVLDRLFTYANGEQLDKQQLDALAAERVPPGGEYSVNTLVEMFNKQVDDCIGQNCHQPLLVYMCMGPNIPCSIPGSFWLPQKY